MKLKKIFWYAVSIFIGAGMAAYMITLLYYNPYYHYETFVEREWFYVGSAVVLGIIIAFIFVDTFCQEKEYNELYNAYSIELSMQRLLKKQNQELSDQLRCCRKEIDQLVDLLEEANKVNSMLNESAASSTEEPPHTQI